MSSPVLGEGPSNATIAIVGEAPGDHEVREGRPFTGAAGKLLDGMLLESGIKRSDCYLTNLLQEQPSPDLATSEARNDFGALYLVDKGRKQPSSRLLEAVARVSGELGRVCPNVIVALGNEPLRWLTGHMGITDWRGSCLEGLAALYGRKVLPTFHPAAILRQWKWRPISVCDLKKALRESVTTEIRQRPRHIEVLTPAFKIDYALATLAALKATDALAFDIEVETRQVQSIAFAWSPEEALVVPFWWGPQGSYWPLEDEELLWQTIQELFQTVPMIGQNVAYDLTFLKEYQVVCAKLQMDTMVAFHVLYPELPKGLEFMTSIFTDQPYYKWMRTSHSADEFWHYNGLDALLTYECAQVIETELKEATV